MSANFNRTQIVIVNSTATMPTAGGTANPTNVTSGQIALIGVDNTVITPGMTVSDHSMFRVVQGTSAGLKWSMSVPGKSLTSVVGRSFTAASKKVVAIGYNRASISVTPNIAAGATASIAVNNSTNYEFSIVVHSDKQTFSQRLGKRTLSFTSLATATQLNNAIQIANAVNNNPDLNRFLTAVIVGDGGVTATNATSTVNGISYTIFQGTGASNYGVEISGKTLAQATGSYLEEIVNFDVFLDDTSGFGAGASVQVLSLPSQGVGTYNSIYNAENFSFGVEGTMNRTQFPIILPTAASSSTGIQGSIVPTVTSTAGQDRLTFSATVVGMLANGDSVTAGGTNEIKFFQTSTVASVVVTVAANTAVISNSVATNAGAAVTKKMLYDVIHLGFSNATHNTGSGTSNDNLESIMIAIPAIDTSGTYNSIGTVGTAMLAVINPYINSLGFANITI